MDRADLRDWVQPVGEPRPERPWRSRLLTAGVLASAVAAATAAAIASDGLRGLSRAEPAFWVVAALVVLAELRRPGRAAGRDLPGATAVTTLVLAALLHWGLAAALLLQAVGAVLGGLRHGRSAERTAFDVARRTVGWTAAYGLLLLAGQSASPATPSLLRPQPFEAGDLPAALAAGGVFLVVSTVLAALTVAWRTGTSVRGQLRDATTSHWATAASLLALAPLVVLAAERSAVLVPLTAVPLFWVHRETRAAVERRRLLRHDALTGLANRTSLLERATAALAPPGRTPGGQAALLLLDLDRFREATGALGLAAGDALLKAVADRLTSAVGAPDTVARTGGDEFALLLPGAGEREALATAARVAALLDAPFPLPGGQLAGAVLDGSLHARSVLDTAALDLHATIGIALAPDHAQDVGALLHHAEQALHRAKELGVDALVATPDAERRPARFGVLGELRRAVQADGATGSEMDRGDREADPADRAPAASLPTGTGPGRLELHFQPQVSVPDGVLLGVEALVRWRHPERGLVLPEEFIPLAEGSTLMRPITGWVLENTVSQLRRWQDAGLELSAAVNVGARDLQGSDLPDLLAELLQQHAVRPEQLRLEVTERALAADGAGVLATLRALRALGVGLSLDDVGTGFASIAHLNALAVTEVKVDRQFVGRLTTDAEDAAVVRAVVELGAALGLRVVAEGVEDAATWQRLAALGCGAAQGFWIAEPAPAEDLTPWLVQHARGWRPPPPSGDAVTRREPAGAA